MTRETYGSLPSLFWECDQGRAIQARGKDAVIVSNYLRANPHATMIGLYRVRLDQVLLEHPVLESIDTIRAAFTALRETLFADYDEPTAFVWVREMARERLSLAPGEVLDPEDRRRMGAQRLYDKLSPSPFVEPFFQTYGRALRLRRRNFAQQDLGVDCSPTVENPVRGSPLEAPCKPLVSPFEGAPIARSDQIEPDQTVRFDQEDRSDRTTAAESAPRLPMLSVPQRLPDDHPSRQASGTNYQVIERVAWELIRDRDLAEKYYEFPIERESDLVEVTKRYCAAKKIDYGRQEPVPFDVVYRAVKSVWLRAHQPNRDAKGWRRG